METATSLDRIREAAGLIDPVFLNTPQFVCEPLSEKLGLTCVLKVETINPIRSFKGRGADYLLHRVGHQAGGIVCASAGNFGQGMAYAARKRGDRLTVFAGVTANPLKVAQMRALGATVVLEGTDFDEAKEGAQRFSTRTGALYVEDGLHAAVGEGAGTIGLELCRLERGLDAVFVPLGNGALVNGIGTWIKRFSPATRVIAVCPAGAPAMELSWRAGHAISTPTMSTIADGIAVRVPVPEALAEMRTTVDEVMLVTDEAMLAAMRMLFATTAIVVEPAGAAGIAAMVDRKDEFAGKVVATPLTGGNPTIEQMRTWLFD